MPIQSGALAGLANLRDNVATQYQAQLDSIAGGLVNAFAETNTSDRRQQLPGLFTYVGRDFGSGRDARPRPRRRDRWFRPPSIRRRAAISISSATAESTARPTCRTRTGASGYNTLIAQDISALERDARPFPPERGFRPRPASPDYAANSASWLDGQYQSASNDATYQSTLLDPDVAGLVQRDWRQYRQRRCRKCSISKIPIRRRPN